jgi:ATP-binding cassette subfamily G (WHITE) protein 2 (PDR)
VSTAWTALLRSGETPLTPTEFITAKRSKGEILVFPRGHIPKSLLDKSSDDAESQTTKTDAKTKLAREITGAERADAGIIQRQTAVFSWKDVVYDIKIKGEPRRILDHVDGWVKPGTLTALMVGRTHDSSRQGSGAVRVC